MEEQETPQIVPDTHASTHEKWYTPLTRVTPLSHALTLTLLVVLPVVGFWMGVCWVDVTMTEEYVAQKLNSDTVDAPSLKTVNSQDQKQSMPQAQEEYSGIFATELVVEGERYEVALVADDLTTEQTTDSFCGHDAGVLRRSGSFRLVSRKDGREAGSVAIDHARWFAEERLHDGIRLIHEPRSGVTLIGIYQYESCNTESLALYHLASNGVLKKVPFVQEEGSALVYAIGTSRAGIEHLPSGLRACVYSNANFTTYCSTYDFIGSAMQRVDYDVVTES